MPNTAIKITYVIEYLPSKQLGEVGIIIIDILKIIKQKLREVKCLAENLQS